MIIEVKEEDILKALRIRAEDPKRWPKRVCYSCPIAQAIRRDNPEFTEITVGITTATMVTSKTTRRVVLLPVEAGRYTREFDGNNPESYRGLRFETNAAFEAWIG